MSDVVFEGAGVSVLFEIKLRTGTVAAAVHALPVEICLGATLHIVTRPAALNPVAARLKIGSISLLLSITTLTSVVGMQLHEVRGGLPLLRFQSGYLLPDLLQLFQLLSELRWFFLIIEVALPAVIFVVIIVSENICP